MILNRHRPVFSISGSDFVDIDVGVGGSRVRDLFEHGKKNAPCIIFMDQDDIVAREHRAALERGRDGHKQMLNALLVEMDSFESRMETVEAMETAYTNKTSQTP